MNRSVPFAFLVVLLVAVSGVSLARKSTPLIDRPTASTGSAPGAGTQAPGSGVIAAGVLQLWTFDDGSGNPDPQGWTTFDRTFQPAYFHVASGTPLASKVMWCGASPCQTIDLCSYATLPGYGNEWHQRLQSVPINVDNFGVNVNFVIQYDAEPSYDFVYLEYESGNVWHELASWTGAGSEIASKNIAPGTYSSPLRLRFRFVSDFSYSDEDGLWDTDGAAFIDNLQVVDSGGPEDFQDFESEPLGATTTADGDWQALGPPAFGDYAGLFDGDNVVQEDPGYFDSTNLWGFFNGSLENFSCGGYPGQLAVPHGDFVDGLAHFISNEIRSPVVSLAGVAPTEPVMLTFDAYLDLPLDNLVYYSYRVRSHVAGAWKPWRPGGLVFVNYGKVWITRSHNLKPLIPSGATDIQVSLGVVDVCPDWCGVFGSGFCHSHAPLFDNIRVTGSNTPTGPGIVVQPIDPTTGTIPVTVTFNQVNQPGLTTVVTGPVGPTLPGSFVAGNSIYYNVSTSAVSTGNIEVCVQYNEGALLVPEAMLRVLHWDTELNPDAWVDVTTSLDTDANYLCGTTDHLSPFVIGAGSLTGIGDGKTPTVAALHQNVPNPFNPMTTIAYDVPAGGTGISLRIYDATGRLVRTLVDEHKPAGSHDVTWDGRDETGTSVASGVYFYKMIAGSFVESRRMVLLK